MNDTEGVKAARMQDMTAGAIVVAYVEDELTDHMFWQAVHRARAIYKLGDGRPDEVDG